MIVRVGFLDKDENYIARLANYYSAHANETVQFEIYLFTKEEALRKQLSRGGRMDLLVAEEDLLPEPEEYSRNMELAFWSTEKHEQKRNGYPVVFRYQKASEIFREFQSMAAKRGHGASSFEMQANGQVVLFINGAGGAGSGTAAAGCAAAMAAQGKNTVCFTLKQNACNDSFDICGSSMTDVMYEISMWRQLGGKDQGQLQMKLQSMLKQDNETEVYSFAPFDLPVSAMNFDPTDYASPLNRRHRAARFHWPVSPPDSGCCCNSEEGTPSDAAVVNQDSGSNHPEPFFADKSQCSKYRNFPSSDECVPVRLC